MIDSLDFIQGDFDKFNYSQNYEYDQNHKLEILTIKEPEIKNFKLKIKEVCWRGEITQEKYEQIISNLH